MNYIRAVMMVVTVLLFLDTNPAPAANHALLVGVSDYPHVSKLYGPEHDVASLRELLTTRYGFPAANITTLIDSQATKKKILESLAALKGRTSDGDMIFFYFSGHGTSAYDRDAGLSIDSSTGAIIPYDFQEVKGKPELTLERLIIGRRDLQPLLKELDRSRKLFVVFDSCFSGNAVRALQTGRGLKFVPLDIPVDTATFSAVKELPFPYQNLVYEAAAHQTEAARDLQPGDGTFDGKPHGALTNYLLLGMKGEADLNHDGTITYEELHEYARQKVQAFSHTPQVKSNRSLATPVLEKGGMTVAPTQPVASADTKSLRVQVTGDNGRLAAILNGMSGVTIVTERPDLRLNVSGDRVMFLLPGGDTLCSVAVKEARERVERYARSREILALTNPAQQFNVFLRPLGDDGRTVFFSGEKLGVQVTSEQPAHLLLLDIDPLGYVTLLLPNAVDSNRVSANSPLTLAEIGEIEPPLGVEYLKLFAFRSPVSGLTPFLGKHLSPDGPEFGQLLALIRRQQGWSSTIMEVVTLERQSKVSQ